MKAVKFRVYDSLIYSHPYIVIKSRLPLKDLRAVFTQLKYPVAAGLEFMERVLRSSFKVRLSK